MPVECQHHHLLQNILGVFRINGHKRGKMTTDDDRVNLEQFAFGRQSFEKLAFIGRSQDSKAKNTGDEKK